MRLSQAINRALTTRPDGLAVIDGAVRRSWVEVHTRVARGAGLLRGLGIDGGARVAILADNSSAYFELFHAVPWAGGALVPLNTRLTTAELAYILADSGADCLLFGAGYEEVAGAAAAEAGLANILPLEARQGPLAYSLALETAMPVDDALRGGADLAGIFYTSGTTGRQKGVMLTHDCLASNALSVLTYIPFNRSSVNIHAAPMFHLAAIGIYPVTMVGGTHVFSAELGAEGLVRAISDHGVTHCMTVPIIIDRMARLVAEEGIELPSLQMLGYGGSPISPVALDRARSLWPEVSFVQGYGLTEAPSFTFLAPSYHTRDGEVLGKLRSAGEPVFSFEVSIQDPETGEMLAPGQTGEICARGPHVMAGYWNNPEATRAAFRDGWLRTGDAGHLDDDGFLTITDRIKDMIVTGGENVYSLEVENVVTAHPDVAGCAVIGIPHPEWGEAVHAVVCLKEGAGVRANELDAFCRERLARYKCPKSFAITGEPLPLTSSGKVRKAVLREAHAAKHTTAPD